MNLIQNGISLKIVGIIKSKDETTSINESVAYNKKLIKEVIESINNSQIVLEQKSNPNINVFTGKQFDLLSNCNDNLKQVSVYDEDTPSNRNLYMKDFDIKKM